MFGVILKRQTNSILKQSHGGPHNIPLNFGSIFMYTNETTVVQHLQNL